MKREDSQKILEGETEGSEVSSGAIYQVGPELYTVDGSQEEDKVSLVFSLHSTLFYEISILTLLQDEYVPVEPPKPPEKTHGELKPLEIPESLYSAPGSLAEEKLSQASDYFLLLFPPLKILTLKF